jgi:GH25 family lysozyme M1 (1,4-beta-N-acetylmuramidase)
MTSAQGIDVSAYQAPLTPAALDGLDFAFAKATNGPYGTDPNFSGNWAEIRAAGKLRGAYHELTPGDPSAQAAHFLATVQARGLEAGDMLACVASDYPATDADVRAFCDSVHSATSGRNPVLVYSDLSVARTLTSCTGYDLWAAWPSASPPESVAPWKTWRLWQWSETALDRDAFNGSAAEMTAWLATFTHPAPAPGIPAWQETLMEALPTVREGSTGGIVKTIQGLCAARGHAVTIDGSFGPATLAAVKSCQATAKVAQDGIVGPVTWQVLVGVS